VTSMHLRRLTAGSVLLVALAACTRTPPPPPGPDHGPSRPATWSTSLPADLGRPLRGHVTEQSVVVQTERGLVVLDRTTGAPRWRQATGGGPGSRAVVAGSTVVLLDQDAIRGTARIFDLAAGTQRATFATTSAPGALVVGASTAFAVSPASEPGTAYRVTAFDLATGALRWQRDYPGPVQLSTQDTGGYASPLSPADLGTLVVNVQQPDKQWTTTSVAVDTGADVARFSGPTQLRLDRGVRVMSGTTVLRWDPQAPACGLSITGYDARAGVQRWQDTIGQWQLERSPDDASCGPPWTPRVSGTRLLSMDTGERPQVRDIESGAVRWTGPAGSYPLTTAGDVVVVRDNHGVGNLVGYDIASGAKLWHVEPDAVNQRPLSPPNSEHAGAGDRLVIAMRVMEQGASTSGRVVLYDARSGKAQWMSTGSVHLLGASPEGVVVGQYAEPLIGEGLPTEVRFYPL
jgi:outer membrane protein assembly factor BamB